MKLTTDLIHIPADLTVYAQCVFTADDEIAFVTNGGIWRDGTSEPIIVATNASGISSFPESPIKDGSRFVIWKFWEGLTAQWTADPSVHVYTVTLNGNGGRWGSNTTKTQMVFTGGPTLDLSSPTVRKTSLAQADIPTGQQLSARADMTEGLYYGANFCTFNGWNTQANGSGRHLHQAHRLPAILPYTHNGRNRQTQHGHLT